MRGENDDSGTDRRAIVKVSDILVAQANAARRDIVADCVGLVGAVYPVERVSLALPEVHRTGAERVFRSTAYAHTALELHHLRTNFGLALQVLFCWIPVRPFLLVVHGR